MIQNDLNKFALHYRVMLVPLNHAKLSTGGAASLLQVRVTGLPSVTSPTGYSDIVVKRGASENKEEDTFTRSIRT